MTFLNPRLTQHTGCVLASLFCLSGSSFLRTRNLTLTIYHLFTFCLILVYMESSFKIASLSLCGESTYTHTHTQTRGYMFSITDYSQNTR